MPLIDPKILAARDRLQQGREQLRLRHEAGGAGPQICALVTDLFDRVVLDIWAHVIAESDDVALVSQLALIAHGGFGRRDLAPYSDVDLMLVPRRAVAHRVQDIAGRLTRGLSDARLELGFSVRTPQEACSLAWQDPTIFSSLSEARLLVGSLNVYERFFAALRRGTRRRSDRLIRGVQEARREERTKWGETNYLLRPNIKRSRGGLRDLQLIRWIGFIRDGETELGRLVKLGSLPTTDYGRLQRAQAFLLRLRNELHFLHGRSHDVLDRPTQMRIADKWGYQGREGRLPVEMFMQDYFEHTHNIRYASTYVCADARSPSIWRRMIERTLSRRVEDAVRVGPYHVWVEESELPNLAGNLANVLRLMDIANRYSRRIEHRTWQAIREAMSEPPASLPDSASIRSFLSLMGRPGRLAPLLRRLHELRVLEQFVPAMRRARGLLQFNEYHKYTVDRHCIRAVEAATHYDTGDDWMHELYRRLDGKLLLHLALLIHDLGKGFQEDHSDVGLRIAAQTADRLGLDSDEKELLGWLVHKHLIMHYAAFRHDLSDPQIIAKFADDVGNTDRLELLTLMSLADLTAVGPDVLTDWKQELLRELYNRTRAYLDTGRLPDQPSPQALRRREAIRQLLVGYGLDEATIGFADELPDTLVMGPSPEFTAEMIRDTIAAPTPPEALCRGRFDAGRGATEYTMVMPQRDRPVGIFAKVTGALAACGLSILKAEINTLREQWIWDTFLVEDPGDLANHDEQIARTAKRVSRIVTGQESASRQRRLWAPTSQYEASSIRLQPAKVDFDNDSIDRYTVILLFAYDRPGLLAAVAAVLAKLNIVLHFAKIDTHLDQAVDVFYVSELDGTKLRSPQRLAPIRAALLAAVEPEE